MVRIYSNLLELVSNGKVLIIKVKSKSIKSEYTDRRVRSIALLAE